MNRSQRIAVALAGVAFTALLSAGSASAENAGQSQSVGGTTALTGAGATFPAPLYQRWLIDYKEARPDLSVSYEPVGSGEGVKRFLAGTVDFGASEGLIYRFAVSMNQSALSLYIQRQPISPVCKSIYITYSSLIM